MKATVTFTFSGNAAETMRRMGLGGDKRAQIYLASQIKTHADKYTPMQHGDLIRSGKIADDGSAITYTAPYAHYMWKGETMGPNYTNGEQFWSGNAPKQYTGGKLTYHGGPMRGPHWVERMMADKADDIGRDLKTYIGGLK